MAIILLLRHNLVSLLANNAQINNLLVNQQILTDVVAPVDFAGQNFDSSRIGELIAGLLKMPKSFSVIILEANLGFPGAKTLDSATIKAMQRLVEHSPQALFILKSHTSEARDEALSVLKRNNCIDEQIVCEDGGTIHQTSLDAIAEKLRQANILSFK